jgi:hypothetical protein
VTSHGADAAHGNLPSGLHPPHRRGLGSPRMELILGLRINLRSKMSSQHQWLYDGVVAFEQVSSKSPV